MQRSSARVVALAERSGNEAHARACSCHIRDRVFIQTENRATTDRSNVASERANEITPLIRLSYVKRETRGREPRGGSFAWNGGAVRLVALEESIPANSRISSALGALTLASPGTPAITFHRDKAGLSAYVRLCERH